MVSNRKKSTDESETPANYKMKMEDLKRGALHASKKAPLYPLDQLEDEDSKESPSKDNKSPSKDFSGTEADFPTLKPEPRHRRGDKTDSGASHVCDTPEKGEIDKTNENGWNWNFVLIIIIAVTIIVVISGLIYWNSTPVSSSQPFDINKVMQNIKNRFPGQPETTYKIVRSEINTAVSEKKLSPGIIILLASREAQDLNNRFALHLAKLFSHQSDYISIESDVSKSFHELKVDIEVNIKSKLKENEKKAVIVNELTRFPFEAALMFHSLCDHENAPFKNALYVITIYYSNETIPISKTKAWDALATKYLKAAWKDSEEDTVSSLISRLTGSVALIVGKS